MKRLLFVLFVTVLAAHVVHAQKLYQHNLVLDSLRFRLDVGTDGLAVQLLPATDFSLTHISIDSVTLNDADLILWYHPKKVPDKLSLQLSIEMRNPQGYMIRNLESLESNRPIDPNVKKQGRLVWMDATETILEPGTTHTIFVRQELFRTIPCGSRPEFTLKKQLPYLAVATGGVVAAGIGLGLNSQKKASYERYQDVWSNEGGKAEAEPYLADAQNQEKWSNGLFYGGLGLIGVGAGLYIWQWIKTRRLQADYDVFCTDATSGPVWTPTLDFSSGGPAVGVVIRLGH